MEKCRKVLRGYDVEPVTMMDNGESSDLELFYQCKKTAEELAYLNAELSRRDESGVHQFFLEIDVTDAIKEIQKMRKSLLGLKHSLYK